MSKILYILHWTTSKAVQKKCIKGKKLKFCYNAVTSQFSKEYT